MAERKGFLLRVPPELYAELERWARDELRSVNAQIEFLLTRAVQENRRGKPPGDPGPAPPGRAGGPESA